MRKFYIDNLNKSVILKFEYNEKIVEQIKMCGYSARWNPEFKEWTIGVTEFNKDSITKILEDYCFEFAEKEQAIPKKFDYSLSETTMDRLRDLCEKKDFAYTPRDYQLECLYFCLEKGNVIIGDDVGLGKTFEAIIYAEVTESFPLLIITPASVKYNWKEKYEEITKGKRSVAVIESRETTKHKNNWDADVVIINYDIIGKKQGTGAKVRFGELTKTPWKMVVSDESHMLKESKSIRSKAARRVMKKGIKTVLLTGTATMNKPIELWRLLELTRYDNVIVNHWKQFAERYCGAYQGKYGMVTDGATNIFELNDRMRNTCYIRREKRDVLKELPPVTKQIIHTTFSKRTEYIKATNNLISYIEETKGVEASEKAMEAEHLVAITLLRKLAIEGKVDYIKNYLKEWKYLDKGKLLIFGIHKEALEELSEYFKCPLIAGGVSSKKKQSMVNEWQMSEDIFMFANMQSAGTGVDGFQKVCDNMLIIELPWRPSDLEQAIGRIDRSGQTLPVTITFALAEDTIDMDMLDMISAKEAITEAVNKGVDVKRNKSGLKQVLRKIKKRGKISK